MSNVVELQPRPPCPEVVEFLELALERARNGEISGVLQITQEPGSGDVYYMVAGLKDRMAILGFLSHAMFKLQMD